MLFFSFTLYKCCFSRISEQVRIYIDNVNIEKIELHHRKYLYSSSPRKILLFNS